MDILLTGKPDPGVEVTEEEPVVPGFPAVDHFVWVGLVHSVVYAVVSPQLAALWLGDSLRPHAPVRCYERGDGEQKGEEIQANRQKSPAFATRLHCPLEGGNGTEKFMCAK